MASLDDPSEFRSQMHTWISDAQPWDNLNPVLPSFEKYPIMALPKTLPRVAASFEH